MKKLSIIILAAMAMVSCGNTYTAQQAELANMNDSINFALGIANGSQIKMYYLRNDSSSEAVTEFVDALQAGYDGTVEELTEEARIGKNIGSSIAQSEKTGLADNPAWTLNEKLFFQGLINGLEHDTTVMDKDEARQFFQEKYAASQGSTEKAGKPIKSTCPRKAKPVVLQSLNDSLNYAFGLLNGNDIAMYVLMDDTLGTKKADLIKYVNKGLKERVHNPQLKNMGEQIGKNIKEQEANGLIGEPSLATDFALIKQGFINGLLGDDSQFDGRTAGEYIQNTLNNIKYGNTKEQGEKFLAENKLREGVVVTESGLQYEVLKMGKGKKPVVTDKVKVHYHGTLIDGTVFDSSVDRGEPITFALNQVIAGWTEGVQLMPVGSKFKFYIPQQLGYGERAAGSIPPYSTLIFEVELLGIEK
ncbi:MAG: FKBP-type peptidyl-prolyl cis-trans isomerase [Paludibacteraceae bacterium]|nr:FKBP-type peptidyl-prolyl cis-trans isomerase [Paludibacteraceae bacterium]